MNTYLMTASGEDLTVFDEAGKELYSKSASHYA